jgi:hypothetical protein
METWHLHTGAKPDDLTAISEKAEKDWACMEQGENSHFAIGFVIAITGMSDGGFSSCTDRHLVASWVVQIFGCRLSKATQSGR